MSQIYAAVSDLEIHDPHPLNVRAEETVTIGKRDTTWTEWLWVTASNQISGWIHESYLSGASGKVTVIKDYTARELSLLKGDRLESNLLLGGWHWCRKNDGQEGWVPDYAIQLEQNS